MTEHKHPRSLGVFFATEMWERYGFYVVQTLLALYLALHFKWPDKQVYALVGSFTALTYISPVLGGWIADHLIGQKRSTILGACFLLCSYLLLTCHAANHLLIFALAGIAVGTGLLKSTISSLLGNEYSEQSPHRESGFTIFYMGITTGIILGTTVPSFLNAHFGWSMPFASAAIGILIALSIFTWGVKRYAIRDYHPYSYSFKKSLQAASIIAVMWSVAYCILTYPKLADGTFFAAVVCSLSYLIRTAYKEPKEQAKKTIVIALLCIISALFWAFYFQMFLSFMLFIVRIVQPTLAGFAFPPPYYVAIQSLGMLCIGCILAKKASQTNAYRQGIHAGNKFLLSIVITLCAYGLIAWATQMSMHTPLLSPYYIIPVYLLFSAAELLLSPVGLCAVTVLASRKKVSTMMGIFFVSLGIGGFLAGKLASLTAIPLNEPSLLIVKMRYAASFIQLLKLLGITLLISIGLNRVIHHLMKKDA